MNPLLDTVGPDAWAHDQPNRRDTLHADAKDIWLKSWPKKVEHYTIPLYSRPKVESLLAECRKEAFLEAVQVVMRNAIPYENTANDSADELRRMAEGEKE